MDQVNTEGKKKVCPELQVQCESCQRLRSVRFVLGTEDFLTGLSHINATDIYGGSLCVFHRHDFIT